MHAPSLESPVKILQNYLRDSESVLLESAPKFTDSDDPSMNQIRSLIEASKILRDKQQNITTYRIGNLMLRDARKRNAEKLPDQKYSRLAFYLSYFMATQRVASLYNLKLNFNVEMAAQRFYKKVVNADESFDYQSYMNDSIHLLVHKIAGAITQQDKIKQIDDVARKETLDKFKLYENVLKTLNEIKNWITLEHPTPTIGTFLQYTTKEKSFTFAQLSTPMTALTEEQKNELNNPKDKIWYQRLSPLQERLFTHYRPQILRDHMVSCRQRSTLGVLKNTFTSESIVFEGDNFIPKTLTEFQHGANLCYANTKEKEEGVRLTKSTMEQLKQATGVDWVHIITTNSRLFDQGAGLKKKLFGGKPPENLDKFIVETTIEAANGKDAFLVSNYQLNACRHFSGDDIQNTKLILDEIQKLITDFEELETDDLKLKGHINILRHRHSCCEKIRKKYKSSQIVTSFYGRILSLELIGHLAITIYHYNKVIALLKEKQLSDKNYLKLGLFIHCASGQNRTEIAANESEMLAFYRYLRSQNIAGKSKTHKKELEKDIAEMVYGGFHRAEINGSGGGNYGKDGGRGKSGSSAPSNSKKAANKYYFLKTADLAYLESFDWASPPEIKIEALPSASKLPFFTVNNGSLGSKGSDPLLPQKNRHCEEHSDEAIQTGVLLG